MESRVERFIERAAALGFEVDVHEMDDSTHTAADAAAVVGAPIEAIVKSLLVTAGGEHVLVLASGPNRVDLELVGALLGAPATMADAKTVKAVTGSSIGGVPPIAHPTPIPTLVDESLLSLETVWAAAASSRAVFPIAPARLVELTRGRVASIS